MATELDLLQVQNVGALSSYCQNAESCGGFAHLFERKVSAGNPCFALVPRGTSLERALRFEAGGLISGAQATAWLVERLNALSKRLGNGSFVTHDVWVAPHLQGLAAANLRAHYLPIQGQSYFWTGGPKFGVDQVMGALNAPASFFTISAFCKTNLHEHLANTSTFLEAEMHSEILASTVELYVSAFDQESFLVLQ